MATLEADGAPPQPPHPTMPPYASTETYRHPSELNLQDERPRKPKIWEITTPGTKSHTEPTHRPTATMEIKKTPTSHDTALPSILSPPTASVYIHWQDNRREIANAKDRTDASTQHNAQCGMQTPTAKQRQSLTMLPLASSTTPSHTGNHDNSQCHISSDKPMTCNNTLQKVTTTPNHAHADTTTPKYPKIPEKVPQHQSNHYKNTRITQIATGTIANTTTAYHQHPYYSTPNDAARPTRLPQPYENASITNISAAQYPSIIASVTVPYYESLRRQQHRLSQLDNPPQRPLQMPTAFLKQNPDTPHSCTDRTNSSLHPQE